MSLLADSIEDGLLFDKYYINCDIVIKNTLLWQNGSVHDGLFGV